MALIRLNLIAGSVYIRSQRSSSRFRSVLQRFTMACGGLFGTLQSDYNLHIATSMELGTSGCVREFEPLSAARRPDKMEQFVVSSRLAGGSSFTRAEAL
jgi:hypothetical protein